MEIENVIIEVSRWWLKNAKLRDDAGNRVNIILGPPDSRGVSDIVLQTVYADNPLNQLRHDLAPLVAEEDYLNSGGERP